MSDFDKDSLLATDEGLASPCSELPNDPDEPLAEEPANGGDEKVRQVMPDSVSTDSGVSSGFDESEGDAAEFYYEKPKHLNAFSAKAKTIFEDVKKIIFQIERAIRHKKIFCLGGCFSSTRKALIKRGWVEVASRTRSAIGRPSSNFPYANGQSGGQQSDEASDINMKLLRENIELFFKKESNFKRPLKVEIIFAKLTKGFVPHYEWNSHRRRIPWKLLKKDQMVNKFPSAFFTTKTGLHQSLLQLHWYSPFPVSTFFPRCYQLSNDEEKSAFVDDYRMTACISILQWFCMEFKKFGAAGVESFDAKARRSVVEFSLLRCKELVGSLSHQDVDTDLDHVWEHQWDQFLTDFYLVCHENSKIQNPHSDNCATSANLYAQCSKTLDNILKLRPESIVDGFMNIWIIKPGSSSRGRGISLDMKLENILAVVSKSSGHQGRYIVQKYIERPFLIYETKFDIRQWFLVTSWNPLNVWMYKDSYLRFCSRPFTLTCGHESIHLCNNAVQARYTNAERSSKLPFDNMWDNKTFIQFLKEQGQGDKWSSLIYPTMKKCLISALLANQDNMEFNYKCNAFELYGADFLLSYDLKPWLIEINSSPALGSTTSVTSRMCAMMLEDIVRVTVDRRKGRNVDTGGFELIYKQNTVQPPLFVGTSLCVQGTKVPINSHPRGYRKKFSSAAKSIKLYCKEMSEVERSLDIKPVRVSPPHEDLKALIAQAHRSVYRRESIPVITDLIDNIMSIPSCLQDSNSKVTLVREWIKQNPKPEKIELPEPVKSDDAEKLTWNDTPKDALPKRASEGQVEELHGSRSGSVTEFPDISGVVMSQPVTPKRIAKLPRHPNGLGNRRGVSSANKRTNQHNNNKPRRSKQANARQNNANRSTPQQPSKSAAASSRRSSAATATSCSTRKNSKADDNSSDNDCDAKLDGKEKEFASFALKSLASHFNLERVKKYGTLPPKFSLSKPPTKNVKKDPLAPSSPKIRSAKIRPQLNPNARKLPPAKPKRSKASALLEQVPVCKLQKTLIKYGCCHNIMQNVISLDYTEYLPPINKSNAVAMNDLGCC